MAGLLHSQSKEQREAVRQLLHKVLLQDMSMFNPERFRTWIAQMDFRFGKVGLKLSFRISASRTVTFIVTSLHTKRKIYHVDSATRVQFEDSEVQVLKLA